VRGRSEGVTNKKTEQNTTKQNTTKQNTTKQKEAVEPQVHKRFWLRRVFVGLVGSLLLIKLTRLAGLGGRPVGHWLSKDAKLFPLFDTSNMAISTATTILDLVRDMGAAGLAGWLRTERPDVVALLAVAAPVVAAKKSAHELPAAGAGGSAPAASAYRIPAPRTDCCVGRRLYTDHRWSLKVFGELQCERAVVEGSDLCTACARHKETFDIRGLASNGGSYEWHGRVTEEPPSWLHMLGTAWAAQAVTRRALRLVWFGEVTPEERVSRLAALRAEEAAVKEVVKAEAKAVKAAAKAAKPPKKAKKAAATATSD
jgi:hypothetical protein